MKRTGSMSSATDLRRRARSSSRCFPRTTTSRSAHSACRGSSARWAPASAPSCRWTRRSARPPGDFSWQATLWHELAHVFTLQLSDYRVPRWLTEGMSAYEEHRRQPAWGRELTLEFAARLSKDDTFELKKLTDSFRTPDIALAYFEASLVVEHLEAEHGVAGLRTLLLAYAAGAPTSRHLRRRSARTSRPSRRRSTRSSISATARCAMR